MDERQPDVEPGADALADPDVSPDAAADVAGGAERAGAEPVGKTGTIIEK